MGILPPQHLKGIMTPERKRGVFLYHEGRGRGSRLWRLGMGMCAFRFKGIRGLDITLVHYLGTGGEQR